MIIIDDNLNALRGIPSNSIDSIVTDPPAGINFMQQKFDSDRGGRHTWAAWLTERMEECIRVLKPGAHALVWALPRTSHWTMTAVEDAGFEIRDIITHLFGCLSSDSEVYTEKGWERFDTLEEGRLALAFHVEKSRFEWQPIQEIFVYQDCNDIAYRLVGQHTDQLVSCNHRCVVASQGSYGFERAEDLVNQIVPVPVLADIPESLKHQNARARTKISGDTPMGYTPVLDMVLVNPVWYAGTWWCVQVPSGAFVARRNGKIFITGNSGFPKSLDVSKALDKMLGAERQIVGTKLGLPGYSLSPDKGRNTYSPYGRDSAVECAVTAPASKIAGAFDGVGTALKPGAEYWILARKPLEGTVAQNVAKWGTGGINIDACRVPCDWSAERGETWLRSGKQVSAHDWQGPSLKDSGSTVADRVSSLGRWPTNVVLSCNCGEGTHSSDCPISVIDEQSGVSKSSPAVRHRSGGNTFGGSKPKPPMPDMGYFDAGGASRFFPTFRYCPKASRREKEAGLDDLPLHSPGELTGRRDGSPGLGNPRSGAGRTSHRRNTHPTCKPVPLCQWLIRLITPPGGTVLDPFAGSGTTGVAAVREGRGFIGIEIDANFAEIATKRVRHACSQREVEDTNVGAELDKRCDA